jgi:hypothetical protein
MRGKRGDGVNWLIVIILSLIIFGLLLLAISALRGEGIPLIDYIRDVFLKTR